MQHPTAAGRSRRGAAGDFLIRWRLHQRHAESLPLAVTHRLDLDRLTGIVVAHDSLQSADAIHWLAICGDDDVAGLQTRLLRGSVFRREITDEHAANVFSRPSGLPIARTHSPMRDVTSLPSEIVGKLLPSILITATSVVRSCPITFAVKTR